MRSWRLRGSPAGLKTCVTGNSPQRRDIKHRECCAVGLEDGAVRGAPVPRIMGWGLGTIPTRDDWPHGLRGSTGTSHTRVCSLYSGEINITPLSKQGEPSGSSLPPSVLFRYGRDHSRPQR